MSQELPSPQPKFDQSRLFDPELTAAELEKETAIAFRDAEIERLGLNPNRDDGSPKPLNQIWPEIIRRRLDESIDPPSEEDQEHIWSLFTPDTTPTTADQN